MPDGHEKINAVQVIYRNVTRKHSGTYICEGSNGSGYIATDAIKIDVIRKYIGTFQHCKQFCINCISIIRIKADVSLKKERS